MLSYSVISSFKAGFYLNHYDIVDRQLIINNGEAKTVRYIYDRYLELGSINKLKEDLDRTGVKSKSWISKTGNQHFGQSYSHGAVHYLLSNPIYAGLIRHKGEVHEGLHEAIIPRDKWQLVQDTLMSKACTDRGQKHQSVENILKGKIFNTDGTIYTPTLAKPPYIILGILWHPLSEKMSLKAQ